MISLIGLVERPWSTERRGISPLFFISKIEAFLALRRRKERNAFMSEKIIRIKSGNEEITMDVTKEEYQRYYRPWWRMKKKEQRNREAMVQNGYTEESYEGWKDGLTEGQEDEGPQVEGADAVIEKRELLEILGEALDALLPEERELAVRVVGEEMPVAEFARMKKENRRTLASRRDRVLEKLRLFFEDRGFDVHK